MSFTSLAAFKRALQPGTRWQKRYSTLAREDGTHALKPVITNWQPRVVAHLQTNAVAFATAEDTISIERAANNPHGSAIWLHFPKADRCSFPEPGTIRIQNGDADHWLEYRQLITPTTNPQ